MYGMDGIYRMAGVSGWSGMSKVCSACESYDADIEFY
jgi:hypothetical protein